jgi:hypothetical protein
VSYQRGEGFVVMYGLMECSTRNFQRDTDEPQGMQGMQCAPITSFEQKSETKFKIA